MSYDYIRDNTCGSCEYYTNEGEYTKGYCSWYKAYYYHDDSCGHYQRSDNFSYGGSGGCFLTTACCKYKGLPDDCKELMALRFLRDNYMKKYDFGQALIKIYYDKAPDIVTKINSMKNSDEIYESIYQKIKEIVVLIDDKKFINAVEKYVNIMFWVEKL